MTFVDWVVLLIVAVIIGCALWYIIRTKKRGAKCIGCPNSGDCSCSCSD